MNEKYPTPYPELNKVLQNLVESVQVILGLNFFGAYLQGSFAVGDFDIHSDVDFIMVTQTDPSDDQIQVLQVMHERIYNLDTRWAQHLEGSYFPKEVLRCYTGLGEKLWYLDNGSRSLIKADHCNTIVSRWVLRENGITLSGPPSGSLVDQIPVELLRKEIMKTIVEWGQKVIDDPEQFNNRFYQTFIVLNYCRMLHDLYMGSISSKRVGAQWAKINLDSSWHGLIDRSWSGRPYPEISSREPADPKDFENTLKFVQYIINKTRQYEEAV